MPDAAPVQFERPPLREVAVAVRFDPVPGLHPVHVGTFWEQLSAEFPKVSYVPASPPLVNPLDAPFSPGGSAITIGTAFPMDFRYRFSREDGSALVQLQPDFLSYNWTWQPETPNYPGYLRHVRPRWQEAWRQFRAYCDARLPKPPIPRACTVTYVSVIPADGAWEGFRQFDRLFVPWNSAALGDSIAPPAWVACHAAFPVPDVAGGVIEVDYQPLLDTTTGARAVRMVTTGAADVAADADEAIMAAMDAAHDRSVELFTKLTGPDMHQAWGRVQ